MASAPLSSLHLCLLFALHSTTQEQRETALQKPPRLRLASVAANATEQREVCEDSQGGNKVRAFLLNNTLTHYQEAIVQRV